MIIKRFYRQALLSLAMALSITRTPLMILLYPFWVRFSHPSSIWNIINIAMILAYPFCIIAVVYSVWRQKFLAFLAYSSPFVEAAFLATYPNASHILYVAGFLLFSFPTTSLQNHCQLTTASENQNKYVIGWCEKTLHQGVLGFHSESDMIIYDSQDPIAADADQSGEKIGRVSDLNVWNMVVTNHPPSLNDDEVQDIMAEPLGSNF